MFNFDCPQRHWNSCLMLILPSLGGWRNFLNITSKLNLEQNTLILVESQDIISLALSPWVISLFFLGQTLRNLNCSKSNTNHKASARWMIQTVKWCSKALNRLGRQFRKMQKTPHRLLQSVRVRRILLRDVPFLAFRLVQNEALHPHGGGHRGLREVCHFLGVYSRARKGRDGPLLRGI